MIVRKPTREDIEPVLELIHEFHKEVIDDFDLLCNDDIAREFMAKTLDTALVLETDEKKIVGVIAGTVTTYPLDNKLIYQEIIWYVNKEYRRYGVSKLLTALEEKCKDNNIKHIIMVHMTWKAEEIGRFYLSQGYKYLETQYIKTL